MDIKYTSKKSKVAKEGLVGVLLYKKKKQIFIHDN